MKMVQKILHVIAASVAAMFGGITLVDMIILGDAGPDMLWYTWLFCTIAAYTLAAATSEPAEM